MKQNNIMQELFFELIRLALGQREQLSHAPSEEEWNGLFHLAQKQSIVGICFSGIERLPKGEMPEKKLLLNWYAQTQLIEERNILSNRRCAEISEQLRKDGFHTCILKGQGVANYYPNPLRRQSGDIDVWVRTETGDLENDRNRLIEYVRGKVSKTEICYHHADYNIFEDIPIELHFMPTRLYCKPKDKKLQDWFEQTKAEQFAHGVPIGGYKICVPTDRFNTVFLLLHIAKHILEEGIGLRQLMDYYFLLISNSNLISRDDFERLFKDLGLFKTAQAVMYVLQEIFGLDKAHQLCTPDEKDGRLLIDEIMLSGNFGHYDPRFGELQHETPLQKFIRKQTRIFRFFSLSPSETLWSPIFSIYQRLWRHHRGLL